MLLQTNIREICEIRAKIICETEEISTQIARITQRLLQTNIREISVIRAKIIRATEKISTQIARITQMPLQTNIREISVIRAKQHDIISTKKTIEWTIN